MSHFVIKPASIVNSWKGAFYCGSVVDGLILRFTLGSPHLTCFCILICYIFKQIPVTTYKLHLKTMKAQLWNKFLSTMTHSCSFERWMIFKVMSSVRLMSQNCPRPEITQTHRACPPYSVGLAFGKFSLKRNFSHSVSDNLARGCTGIVGGVVPHPCLHPFIVCLLRSVCLLQHRLKTDGAVLDTTA